MPRNLEITVPSAQTDELVQEIQRVSDVITLRLQRDTSLKPPGDLIQLQVTDRSLHDLMQFFDSRNMLQDPQVSITTQQPLSIVSKPFVKNIITDTSEATWEEIQSIISKESNMTANGMLTMMLSGIIAAIGISTNALHLVVGAMVIAPGFEPIARIPLGFIAGSMDWKKGLMDTLKAYLVLVLSAAVTALVLQALGNDPLEGKSSYLAEGSLLSYWTSITVPSLIVSAAGGLGGALVIAAQRPLLTAGVMIALALIPSGTLMGMALADGNMEVLGQAAVRWVLDVVLVVVFSAAVFLWKRASVHRRSMSS